MLQGVEVFDAPPTAGGGRVAWGDVNLCHINRLLMFLLTCPFVEQVAKGAQGLSRVRRPLVGHALPGQSLQVGFDLELSHRGEEAGVEGWSTRSCSSRPHVVVGSGECPRAGYAV